MILAPTPSRTTPTPALIPGPSLSYVRTAGPWWHHAGAGVAVVEHEAHIDTGGQEAGQLGHVVGGDGVMVGGQGEWAEGDQAGVAGVVDVDHEAARSGVGLDVVGTGADHHGSSSTRTGSASR